MRELLRVRLAECGWKDEMVLLCRKVIAENDVNTLTVDDILDKITPQGRGTIFLNEKKIMFFFCVKSKEKINIYFSTCP